MMTRWTKYLLLWLWCVLGGVALLGVAGRYPLTIADALHHPVMLKGRPQRIISLAPSVTEILFAIGAGNRVLADTTYCKYPAAAARLAKIGGYLDPNAEKVVALTPDLVIAARGTRDDILDHLRALHVPLFVVDANNLTEVSASIKLIGRLVGNETTANQVAARLEARRNSICKKTAALAAAQRPATLFLFSFSDLFSAGPGSHIDELIRLAGGRNIAAGTRQPWPQLSMEAVAAANPQVILVLAGHGTMSNLTPQAALATLRAKPQWRSLAAVKTGRVVVLDDDEMTLTGPRLINGLEAVARALHPELFPGGGKR